MTTAADNSFANTDLVAGIAIVDLANTLNLISNVDRQLDEKQVFSNQDVGATVNVKRPIRFITSTGSEIVSGDLNAIEQGKVPVTLEFWDKVTFPVTTQQLTLNIDTARTDLIKPMVKALAQKIESRIATAAYQGFYQLVGTPGTTPATLEVLGDAKQKLDEMGTPMDDRNCFVTPKASNAIAIGLKTYFAGMSTKIADKAIEEGYLNTAVGFTLYQNQSLVNHTVGAHGGTPLVNGASQQVTYATAKNTMTQSLITDGWTVSTAVLKKGDVFTLAGVYSVNPDSGETLENLQQFVVNADATSDGSGNATLSISPPIIIEGAYKTVSAAPANNAAITVVGTASTSYPQNLAFHKNAVTMAMARLDTVADGKGAEAVRKDFKNLSMRLTKFYIGNSDTLYYRLDALYGIKVQNPAMGVRITG